ncbi:sensor histidine kinase [Xylanimonas sp. McL0601]|uniref:sensor histidine kinase n=1 Tax=Xylanimonas sp. McL0601 TaxID=3414739 RepID=UPI003CFB5C84
MPTTPAADASTPARALGRGDVLTAAVTWAVSGVGLLILPAASALEPTVTADVPALGGVRWCAALVAITLAAAAVAWARLRPVSALLVVGAVVVLLAVTRPGDASGLVNPAVLVVVYRTVVAQPLTHVRTALMAAGALVAGGLAVANALSHGGLSVAMVATSTGTAAVLVATGVVSALWVASRRAVLAARAGELEALAREQDALLRSAVAAERTAMAREVHDIAAHHLSGMALMLAAVDRQVDADPAAAHEGVRQVRAQSRLVLNDLRRLVGILREDGAAEASGPFTLAAVRELVDGDVGTASIEIRPASDGAALGSGLGPVAQLAAYRMVQEALSNARRHAPGATCVVTVDDSAHDAVVLTVCSEGPGLDVPPSTSGGHGLLGMRERAELAGATLRYGPTIDGAWEVRLRIPRDCLAGPAGGSA